MNVFIPISKNKLNTMLYATLALTGLSAALMGLNVAPRVFPLLPPALVNFIAMIVMVLSGVGSFVIFSKLQDKSAGLRIDATGVIDASSGVSLGRIPWQDVESIEEFSAAGQSFVVLKLHDPEQYLIKYSGLKRKIHEANLNLCGSPAAISAGTLQADYEDVLNLLQQGFQHYRENSNQESQAVVA
ncbi:STM3941 family protein [Permianibacter aggregans]|uniref:PH (Pleckstrin Homology) domain-containing protein n=1 Tax=Permianibacter aggregans TaxID=1510150 RepID=A0A4R6UPP4_9GAMM|nr:STM3941 family protein [Permianibacter aggregans]QGX39998.1 hypothetical protein E2H98_10120 [Permianibacter aggregans]TDQ49190.1 hypothetical protein EV696_105164 [Permianibacter aggregans]